MAIPPSSLTPAILHYSQGVSDTGALYSTTISPKMAPAKVLRYTSYSNQARTLTLKGLVQSKKRNLELYNSRMVSNNFNMIRAGSSISHKKA